MSFLSVTVYCIISECTVLYTVNSLLLLYSEKIQETWEPKRSLVVLAQGTESVPTVMASLSDQ